MLEHRVVTVRHDGLAGTSRDRREEREHLLRVKKTVDLIGHDIGQEHEPRRELRGNPGAVALIHFQHCDVGVDRSGQSDSFE